MHREIDEIRRKAISNPWPKYLRSIKIAGLRDWNGQQIRFNFPVCVVAGQNGSGKSTVLQTAAVGYSHPIDLKKSFYPSTFFPDTAWDRSSGVELSYQISEGPRVKEYSLRKRNSRWRFPSAKARRHVIWQDISRTLPIAATVGYAYLAKRTATEVSADRLIPQIIAYYSSIMGRQYDDAWFATADLDTTRNVGVLQAGSCVYSQFHQGAGEDTTLDLLFLLQNIPDTSLLLIDEVEASLHPRSQRRLIHFLLWLARTKQLQIILTTHSPYVLEELPLEARIFLQRGTNGIDVLYGITPDFALNRMDDIDRPDLYLFTEDRESTILIESIMQIFHVDLGRIKCIEVGPANVVAALGSISNTNRLPINSLGVLDADQPNQVGCISLPGDKAPERQVFIDILSNAIPQLALRLGMSEPSVNDAIGSATCLTDHHDWIAAASRSLRQTKEYLWNTMCQVWCINCLDEAVGDSLAGAINDCLI